MSEGVLSDDQQILEDTSLQQQTLCTDAPGIDWSHEAANGDHINNITANSQVAASGGYGRCQHVANTNSYAATMQQQAGQQQVQDVQHGHQDHEAVNAELPQLGGCSTASSPVSAKHRRQQVQWQAAQFEQHVQLTDVPSQSSSRAGSPSNMLNQLGSPSSVFMPANSVTSSLQFQLAAAVSTSLHQSLQEPAVLAAITSSPPPGRMTYSALQLRCQALEVALEQQTQRTEAAQAALTAARDQHAAEEASVKQYYEAQLSDKQHELNLLMQHVTAAAAAGGAESVAGGAGSAVVNDAEEGMGFTSIDVHPSPLAPQQQQQTGAVAAAAAGRPMSPAVAAVAGVASSSVSLTDVALLRRELNQAEGLIKAYQAENKAAANRIKELESQLSSAKAALADEAGRAQRAAAAAAEAQRSSGAIAAERLARQLHLEGQVEQMQSAWQEREHQLMDQIEALRRDKAAAAAQAAAAAEGLDMTQWQADDALVADLRSQLAQQATEHAAQIALLQDKLNWYAENQALLGSADQLVQQQADLIRQLEARLMAAEGAAGRTQAARIAELEEQVGALKAALASRHPSSLPAVLAAAKPGPGEAAALAQAAATIRQLESQLEQQQQTHEHCLRQLQQQYEALKARLEQRNAAQQASGGAKSRVRELTQQLEDQRNMYTRRIRTLEAKLTAAEGAAAAASRRASSSSVGIARSAGGTSRATTAGGAGQKAAGALRSSRQASKPGGIAAGSDDSSISEHVTGLHHPADAAAAGLISNRSEETGAPAGADAAVSSLRGEASEGRSSAVVSGLLRVKERQMAGLVAQLEERTSQFLQLQQKYRAAERQLKQLKQQQNYQQQPDGDCSSDCSRPSSARTRQQDPLVRADVATSPDTTLPRRRSASAALQPHKPDRPASTMPDKSPQGTRKRISTSGGGDTVGAASWPALCAELETENEQLKAALLEARQAADEKEQQVSALTSKLADIPLIHQQQQQHHMVPCQGDALPPAPYLLSVVEETAAREAARWETQVAALQEMLRTSQAEAAALAQELAVCRAKGAWTPTGAAFEALERKINSLEAAAAVQRQQQQHHQQQQLLAGMGPTSAAGFTGLFGMPGPSQDALMAITQQYEAALSAKNAELDGFRAQLDALISAAKQLQEQRATAGNVQKS